MPDKIAIEGINEVRRALKELGDINNVREFKLAGYKAGAEVVIPRAQARAAGIGKMQTKAAATLTSVSTVTGGAVRFGKGFPASMGAEFGAGRDELRNVKRSGRGFYGVGWNQFKSWRGQRDATGYFLWPTIRDDREAIVDKFNEGILPLLNRLFPGGTK